MASKINFLSYLYIAIFLLPSLLSMLNASSITDYLNPHNKIRAKYGLWPLKWNAQLASFAKSYANKRRGDCKLMHSNTNYGENIFWGKGKKWRPSDAIDAWFAERSSYDYNRNKCYSKDCLHYTQLVWRTTLRVGCAKIICKTGDTYIICNYDPHGNIMGQRPY